MYNADISNAGQLPIQEESRKSTDIICTILPAIFAFVLFLLACIFFSSSSLHSAYFSNNNAANKCSSGTVAFFPDINNLDNVECLPSCPPNYYNKNGQCWSKDQVTANIYRQALNINADYDYEQFKSGLFWALLFVFSVVALWLIAFYLFPKLLPSITVILAILTLAVIGILVVSSQVRYLNENPCCKVIVAVVTFSLIVIIASMYIMYRSSIRLQGVFLDYATRFLAENIQIHLYSLVFFLLGLGHIALFIFQHCAFSSKWHHNNNFYDYSNPGFLGWLNLIQLIWGIQFLKDAYHYCVSAWVVGWYWGKKPNHWTTHIRRLFTKNWGSIAAGSFVNAFFELPTLLVELIICRKGTCCSKAGDFCENSCSCLDYVFNLVRTDAYTYINLAGIPFCDSGRECTKICHFNNQFVGNYNPMKHFRFIAHVFLVSIGTLLGYIFIEIRLIQVTFWHIFTLIVAIFALISIFSALPIDSSEAVSTNFFVEHYESHEYELMQKAIPLYRKQVEHFSKKGQHDGNY